MTAARYALGLLLALSGFAASAQGLDEARELYRQGSFIEAAEAARALATPPALALAARALLVEAAYVAPPDEARALLVRANGLAEAALARNPDTIEALLQKAVAQGYLARLEGPVAAHFAGRASAARRLIDHALALAPDNPWAHALLGGWHGEIICRAGRFFGKTFYGASQKEMRRQFALARRLLPGNPVLSFEYAKALICRRAAKNRAEARAALAVALAARPQNAFQALVITRARRLDAALAAPGARRVRAVLRQIEPFLP